MSHELDAHLKKLAIEAQRQPVNSSSRRIALANLVSEMQKSGQICCRGAPKEITNEALQNLFLFICDRIEKYDPNKGEVLQWVNFLLRIRFLNEARRDIYHLGISGWDNILSDSNVSNNPRNPSLLEELRQYIDEDPEGIFRVTYTGGNPQANFQFLVQRILDGYKWREISEELNIPATTLSSFYQRYLTKFLPHFKAYFSCKSNINKEKKNDRD